MFAFEKLVVYQKSVDCANEQTLVPSILVGETCAIHNFNSDSVGSAGELFRTASQRGPRSA